MEAASIAARGGSGALSARVRAWLGQYGLIIVLAALPVYYLIKDLATKGSLVDLGNVFVAGISNGAIWALIALGYTLVYGIIELINFAHGAVFMIGSFVTYGLFTTFSLSTSSSALAIVLGLLAILVIAMLVTGTLNVMIERVGYRPLRGAPKLAPLITAVGFSFILQNIGILWIGSSPGNVPDLINANHTLVTIGGGSLENPDGLAVAVTVPLVLLLTTFITRSRLGKAMRATAQDPTPPGSWASTSTPRSP